MRCFNIHDAHALSCRLIIVEAAEIFARHQRVSLGIFLAIRIQDCANRRSLLLQIRSEYLELKILLFSAFFEVDRKLCRLIKAYLEPLGYAVTTVHTGPEGVELFEIDGKLRRLRAPSWRQFQAQHTVRLVREIAGHAYGYS